MELSKLTFKFISRQENHAIIVSLLAINTALFDVDSSFFSNPFPDKSRLLRYDWLNIPNTGDLSIKK